MTTNSGAGASPETVAGQRRRPVARYQSYGDAERAVDHLSDKGFPVQRVAIIGTDVRMVEQIMGRLNWGGAALRGAAVGAVTGLLFGWIFGALSWITPVIAWLTLAVYGLVYGAIIGALIGLVMYALQRGRRDFTSVRAMLPSRYEVVADAEVADDAVRLLATMGSAG